MFIRVWICILALAVLFGSASATATPIEPETPASAGADLESLLHSDGSLRLDGAFSGTLDVRGWQVILDEERGPIFQPQNTAPQWTNLSALPNGALQNVVYSLAVSGNDVYVGGVFTDAGGVPEADYVARWDGTQWHALGNFNPSSPSAFGFPSVYALAVSGNVVYVGGLFLNAGGVPAADYVARWDGTQWHALGDGALNAPVTAIAVSGNDVYIGGTFTNAGGVPEADYVARWDGTQWRALGASALNRSVTAIAVSGNDVYVGGSFTDAGGIPEADYVARWDGTQWRALGASPLNGAVTAIAVSGNNVYVGGNFTDVAGLSAADYVAWWDGTQWRAMGNFNPSRPYDRSAPQVSALAASGNNVYVGGAFTDAGGIPEADYVAHWDGVQWRAVGNFNPSAPHPGSSLYVSALAVSGDDLLVGGSFRDASIIGEADNVARWDGTRWHGLGIIGDGALSERVYALATSGNEVFVGGSFQDAGFVAEADYVARWNGAQWRALGGSGGSGALNGWVYALAVRGNEVFVGGHFSDAGGVPEADYVARWDGTQWHALGASSPNGTVTAIAVSENNVYIGGSFTNAGGVPEADYVAHWDGTQWRALGGSGGSGALNGWVYALAVRGNEVFVGGVFTDAGGVPEADYVARWDGTQWRALGASPLNSSVGAIAVSGNDVYVGGGFTDAGGVPEADYVARWDGTQWHALGNFNPSSPSFLSLTFVYALLVRGNEVYAGGSFINAAGIPEADYIARWDGTTWHALGGRGNGALNGTVYALAMSDGDLLAGGSFINAEGNLAADYIAAYAVPPSVTSITRLDPTPTRADRVRFRVAFSEPVVGVDADDFTLTADGSLRDARISGVSGDGSAYTVTVATGAGEGALRLDITDRATITDMAGLRLSNLPFVAGERYTVDTIAPAVTAITRLDPTPTRADRVRFRVAFSEPVVGVDANDFTLTADGSLRDARIGEVSGDGSAYTVTVATGAGEGALRLDIPAAATITDLAGNALSGLPFGGSAYTVDTIAPVVTAITRLDPTPTRADRVRFRVVFSEPVVGVDANDFTLTADGSLRDARIGEVSGDGSAYTVTVATGAGEGALRLDIPAAATITDRVGLTPSNLPFTTGETYTITARTPGGSGNSIYLPLLRR